MKETISGSVSKVPETPKGDVLAELHLGLDMLVVTGKMDKYEAQRIFNDRYRYYMILQAAGIPIDDTTQVFQLMEEYRSIPGTLPNIFYGLPTGEKVPEPA